MKNYFLAISILLGASAVYGYRLPKENKSNINPAKVSGLKILSSGLSEIAEKTSPALVFISVAKKVRRSDGRNLSPFDFWFGPRGPRPDSGRSGKPQKSGLGSGFILDLAKGYIMTNNHVVDGADEIELKLANGSSYKGEVIGRDKNTDVALVKIKTKNFNKAGLTQLKLGDSSKMKTGEFVVGLGAPFGLEASVSFGIVSATRRGNLAITALGNFIQTDAAINPGNSGGPLINMDGEVVGVNTAIYSQSGGYNGIGFAVPSNLARNVAEQIINTGRVSRGYLGVQLSELDADYVVDLGLPVGTKGTIVSSVVAGSAAAQGDMRENDIIIKVDGKRTASRKDVQNAIGLLAPGRETQITVYRRLKHSNTPGYGLKDLTVKLGDYPTKQNMSAAVPGKGEHGFGMTLRKLTPKLRQEHNIVTEKGSYVVNVQPDSPAAMVGLQKGVVIINAIVVGKNGQKDFYENVTPQVFAKLASKYSRLTLYLEFQGMKYYQRISKK